MYIKARWNKRDFAGSAKPHYVRRRECPCFGVQAAVCDPSPKAECVPTFACESERGPFVREVEKRNEERLEDKIYGNSFVKFFSSADGEGSQRTGKCMYIKAWRNQGLQMLTTDHAAQRDCDASEQRRA